MQLTEAVQATVRLDMHRRTCVTLGLLDMLFPLSDQLTDETEAIKVILRIIPFIRVDVVQYDNLTRYWARYVDTKGKEFKYPETYDDTKGD